MNLDSVSSTTACPGEPLRQPYQTPRLTIFGNLACLTATGSMAGMEDMNQNNMCRGTISTTFNMC